MATKDTLTRDAKNLAQLIDHTLLKPEAGAEAITALCEEAKKWPENIRVAVNLSPRQFSDPELVPFIRRTLLESGIAPERLELARAMPEPGNPGMSAGVRAAHRTQTLPKILRSLRSSYSMAVG